MHAEKSDFLKNRFIPLLRKTPSGTQPAWGKMTFQQMVEHFSDTMRIASGKIPFAEIHTPPENLQRMRDFVLSDKPFRENTANPFMSEVPAPVRNISATAAIDELQTEIDFFYIVFEKNSLQVTRNPFFGDLNFEENVHLLHKHALHHLRQFGVIVS